MPSFVLRRCFGVLLTLLFTGLVLATGATGTASAADGYRYWNYFHDTNGSWEFAQTGAAEHTPADGAIEAYRYATSTTADGVEPRVDLGEVDFAAICAEVEPGEGEKRVGVLLDYGTEADAEGEPPPAPRGECAVVEEAANGQQVLEAVAELRVEKGLSCAIDGYPAQGCGTPVPDAETTTDEQPVAFDLPASPDRADDPTDEPSPDAADDPAATDGDAAAEENSSGDGFLWPLVGVALLVVVIGGAAIVLGRRNRSA